MILEEQETEEKTEGQTEGESTSGKTSPEIEPVVKVEDGEILIRQETKPAESEEKGSTEGETKTESGETETGSSETGESEKGEDGESKADPYKGKSREDVIKMHQSLSTKLGTQGERISTLEQAQKGDKIDKDTPVEVVAETLQTEKNKLSEMDKFDDGYKEQIALVNELETDLLMRQSKEILAQSFNAEANAEFQKEMAKVLKDEKGINLSDDEFKSVTTNAMERYTENGRLTKRSYHKALVDEVGVDKVEKYWTVIGETKTRDEIAAAREKEDTTKVDVAGPGKGAQYVKIDSLSGPELDRALEHMSLKDINLILEKRGLLQQTSDFGRTPTPRVK